MDEVDHESERVSARNVLVCFAFGLRCLDCFGDRMLEFPSSHPYPRIRKLLLALGLFALALPGR